jgi:hypothetical protein
MFISEARSVLVALRRDSAIRGMERGGVAQAAVDSNVARAKTVNGVV